MVKLKRKKKPPDRLEESQELQSVAEVGFACLQAPIPFWKTRSVRLYFCFDVFVYLIATGGTRLSGERSGGPVIVQFWKSAPIFVQIWKSAPSNLIVLWCFGWVLYDWRVVWHSSFSFYSSPDLVNDGGVSYAGFFSLLRDCSGLFWTFGERCRAFLSLIYALWYRSVILPCLGMRKRSKWRKGSPASSVFYFLKFLSVAEGRSVSDLELEISMRGVLWVSSCTVRIFFLSLSARTCAFGVCFGAPFHPCRVLVCNAYLGKHSMMMNASGGGKMSRPSLLFQTCRPVMDFLWMRTGRLVEMGGTTIGWSQAWIGHRFSWQRQEGSSTQFTQELLIGLSFKEFSRFLGPGNSQSRCGSSSATANPVCNCCVKTCHLSTALRCDQPVQD